MSKFINIRDSELRFKDLGVDKISRENKHMAKKIENNNNNTTEEAATLELTKLGKTIVCKKKQMNP